MTVAECAAWLREHDDYLLITHKNPDGDTVGSASALCSALRRIGKRARLYPNPQLTERLRDYAAPFLADSDDVAEVNVAVDVATPQLFPPGFAGDVALCVDHHPTNSGYAEQTLLRSERSSCGEIVLELICALCGEPTAREADLLYIAVTTDTGCFQYSNTNADTLRAAARLLDYGADNRALNLRFFRKLSRARLKLEGLVYNGMRFAQGGKISLVIVTKEMLREVGATEDDLDDLAGLAGRAESSVMSITIREQDDGSSKVSVRSNPEISSSDLCAAFGGGGHKMAAGCTIQAPPEQAAAMLLAEADKLFP